MDSLLTRFKKEVFFPYLQLLKSQYRFNSKFDYVKEIWQRKLTFEELVKGPFLEKSQAYEAGPAIETLDLLEKAKAVIHKKLKNKNLHKHQTESISKILKGENTVIATGTSSGKTLCYQVPILDDLLRNPAEGLRAIIIYPLNALVNDQLNEWEQILAPFPEIRFARFTGQTPTSQEEYVRRLKKSIEASFINKPLEQLELQKRVNEILEEKLKEIPNRLNHRDAIRLNPPHILITNFSMLEYLLERPIDAPIFQNSRLKFLVLDEVHAYKGVQATEIAFLIRRLKNNLSVDRLTCIGTSATLGDSSKPGSVEKVRKFATDLFGEDFGAHNPIYGFGAKPAILEPTFKPEPSLYIKAAENTKEEKPSEALLVLGSSIRNIEEYLAHDENLFRLISEILIKPISLSEAANRLWPNYGQADMALGALLEIVAYAKRNKQYDDLLPTRLHYFIKNQDGLHVCLHQHCPERKNGKASYFLSRKGDDNVPESLCPACFQSKQYSKLVEVVSCRKCGYLYGALQDLGPRFAQNPGLIEEGMTADFDSFSTELGWSADSFWTYFSIEDELPHPPQKEADEEDDEDDLIKKPVEIDWCVVCGKKRDKGAGYNCACENPHVRKIKIFHRQCPHYGKAKDRKNLYEEKKELLKRCPNCSARNVSGLEPLRRFQESDDETGLAMAIPLAHFQISSAKDGKFPRKLLCFTDHRQRAAAFPSLLEEETFSHDIGRKIIQTINRFEKPIKLVELGIELFNYTKQFVEDKPNEFYDANLFLPVSRLLDDNSSLNPNEQDDVQKSLWIGEVISYFGIPDSARESGEDLGYIRVIYHIEEKSKIILRDLFSKYGLSNQEGDDVIQVLFSFMRQRKAFTLPKGVSPDDPAFGRVTADISFVLRRTGLNYYGWLPSENKDKTYNDNFITDYLRRVTKASAKDVLELAKNIWDVFVQQSLLFENKSAWKLSHNHILASKAEKRFRCNRCEVITTVAVKKCCPKKGCVGSLETFDYSLDSNNIIANWLIGKNSPQYSSLRSEEHTAQIDKDLAKEIEDQFRAEGINLLSSTTTFEMGINIGDLQKILLRNAPPNSASYLQRVGRAGRGKDKNSICVTLCRRTKYDADVWKNPEMIMSGEVRTPVIFINNVVIAKRHFNAMLFASFLKERILINKVLGNPRQQISLEVFLPSEIRSEVPEDLKKVQGGVFLDFLEWLSKQNGDNLIRTKSINSLLEAVSGFENAKKETSKQYENIITDINEELKAFLSERKKLFDKGKSNVDQDRAIKDLMSSDVINVLAKRGFLPRYAFPLDVVALETGKNRWSRDSDVELNRDRGIAIAEFAPGAQVIARKKVFTSAGLYIVNDKTKVEKQWFSQCPNCKQIRISKIESTLAGVCDVCKTKILEQHINDFIEPSAFSIRIERKKDGSERYRRSTLIRQRQALTHFIEAVDESNFVDKGLFRITLKKDGQLFRYNPGPESKGFMLCVVCGCSEPMRDYKKKHKRLRESSGSMECHNLSLYTGFSYGHQFKSYCLIVRTAVGAFPVESLAFALQKGICKVLDLDMFDIGVSWRWRDKSKGTNAEIILHDNTPGGSGFTKQAFEQWAEIQAAAYKICKECNCEAACYDCLKTYGNQSFHEHLNRSTVCSFFETS